MTRGKHYLKGMADGIPIALGYFSVSFGFGIMAVGAGLTVFQAVLISLTNLTSAGQAAGVSIIAAGGGLVEMALTQLVINIRYALMAVSLSQRADSDFSLPKRLVAAYGITDEIFAVAVSCPERLKASYMYGLITISTAGWVLGTTLGASAGNLLPQRIVDALGILLYGMFIAIIIPAARQSRSVLAAVCMAAALSIGIWYLLPMISSGFSVIICAVAAAAATAFIFPHEDDEEGESEQ